MSHIKWLQYSVPVSIALALGLMSEAVAGTRAMSPSFSVSQVGAPRSPLIPLKKGEKETQLAQSNPPPPKKNPGSSSAGGRRNPANCPQDAAAPVTKPFLTALSSKTKPSFTLVERPTFLVYVPKTSAKNAEFSLRHQDGRGVYRTTVALTTTPDLLSITLPAQAPSLEVGKPYLWSFAIICNPDDRVDDRFVTGMVQRIELDPARLRQMQQASPRERVALYQKADVWYDALALLFQLKYSQNDSSLSTVWRELLQAGGVDTMIDHNSEKARPR